MNANNFLFVAESLLNAIVFLLVFAPVVILWLEEDLLVNKKRKKDKKKHHKKNVRVVILPGRFALSIFAKMDNPRIYSEILWVFQRNKLLFRHNK